MIGSDGCVFGGFKVLIPYKLSFGGLDALLYNADCVFLLLGLKLDYGHIIF